MRRLLPLALLAVVGLATGAISTLSVKAPAATPVRPTSTTPLDSASERPSALAPTPSGDHVLLVWSAGGLPADLPDRVAALPRITTTTTVAGGRVDLTGSHDAVGAVVDSPPSGWRVPLDTFAIDPTTYARFVPTSDRTVVAELEPGTALLGSTSAELRRLGAGGTLTLSGGATLTVAGVVDDSVVGAAELVVTRQDAERLGIATERFLLLTHRGDRAEIEAAIRGAADVDVRVRGPGESPWLRHGDAVLPQALVKAQFGEFAYRPGAHGRDIIQDPGWVGEHIVPIDLPVLGRVRCHRGLVRQLRGAIEELDARGLGHLIDPEAFAGCHHPRLIEPDGMPSRHAWGIALDLNADANPTGLASGQDARLIDTFARWGLTWGGFWLVPDPMHVEYIGPPTPTAGKVADDAGRR